MTAAFFHPTQEHLTKLDGQWCCSFSGGKDSTALVTWVEWLRRTGWITVVKPQMVQSNTTVEEKNLQAVSKKLMHALRKTGWECVVVHPKVNERLYTQILGRGLPPIHPGVRRMRWCTRSSKIDPMTRWRDVYSGGLFLTGLRLGESKMRDGKLRSGCSAGGECGTPEPDATTYSPILHWNTCKVVEWLMGLYWDGDVMADIAPITKQLVDIYSFQVEKDIFDWHEPEVTATRFGCIGCPAIGAEATPPRSVVRRYGESSPLNELYSVWYTARQPEHRLVRFRKNKVQLGPIRMASRELLFHRVMDIQKRSGVTLVTPGDERFIKQCWANKVYPRGWSEADELTVIVSPLPLFDNIPKVGA